MRAIEFTEKNTTIKGVQVPIDRVMLIRTIDDATNSKIKAVIKKIFYTETIVLFSGVEYKPLDEFTQNEIDEKIISTI